MSIAFSDNLDKYKVYSFDIFDTLLLRPYIDPQEVWRVIEEEEGAVGYAVDRKSADSFTNQRAIMRKGETSIDEAYQLIPQWCHLKQKELDKEREILSPNSEMAKLWNELGRRGKRRIIISDMYLPKDYLETLLREKGIDGWDAFYLSSDRNARKSSGNLFRVMLKEEGVNPAEICHIGDNKHSDVEVPVSLGINAIHYPKISERFFNICPFASYADQKLTGSLALGWHEFLCNHDQVSYWHRFGYVLGGVLGYLYVSWIVETARIVGIDHLMFVGRDGYAWQKICNALYPEIRTDYFYAPRIMSIAALGATGSHIPHVVRDRQTYMDDHLHGVDQEKVRDTYREYLHQFTFDDRTAIVDGCSSGFSAQRMVENALGRRVFSFYLMTMGLTHYGACLYYAKHHSLPFLSLSEFLFSAPTPPVFWVSKEKVQYPEVIYSDEQFKIDVSVDITKGIVACAKRLHKDKIRLTAHQWIKYCDDFMIHLTDKDKEMLSKARNATDVQQKNFSAITFTLKHVSRRLFGYPLFTRMDNFSNGRLYYERYFLGILKFAKGSYRWYDVNQIVQ